MEHRPDRIDVEELLGRAPLAPPLTASGEPLWKEVVGLFQRHGQPAPPTKLRDELVTAFAWARWGHQAATALSALEKERDEARKWNNHACERIGVLQDRAQAAETELSALKALVGRMVEGLEPFAKEADDWPDAARENLANVYIARSDGGTTYETTFSLADLARARSLLSEAKGEGEKQGASRSQPCADAGAHIPRSPDTQHSDGGTE